MSSSYSSDIAKAKLQDITSKASISPEALIQCLPVVSSYSEKILLVLSFLHSIEGEQALKPHLQRIKECFITQDFEEANRLIKEILAKPNMFIQKLCWPKWSEAFEHIVKSYSIELIYPEIDDKSSRRMFESILGQRYLASDDALSNIQKYYGHIENMEQISEFVLTTFFGEENIYTEDACIFWKAHWPRIENMIDRGRALAKTGDSLPQVRTPGVLTYKTPRPRYMYDREISFNGTTSQSDKNRVLHDPKRGNWVQQNPENPYVASFSGHTVWFAGLLKYMCEGKPKNERQHFFDTMLKAYIAAYLSQGFHSFKEIYDMINEPEVLRSLVDTGIKVNIGQLFFGPDDFLDKILAESIDYNNNLLLRKSAQMELKESARENISSSKFVDPRESYFEKQTEQRNIARTKEISIGDLTINEIELRELLFSGKVTPEQAFEQLPKSPLISRIVFIMAPQIAATLDMDFIISLYQQGIVQDEAVMFNFKASEVAINTKEDGFWKNSSTLTQKDKKLNVQGIFYKLQLACLKNDTAKINSEAIALFKAACTVRSKFSFSEYSSGTSSAKSLIQVLLQPKNVRILEALRISLDVSPKDIEKKLIEMMQKAFKNEELISPITPLPGGGKLCK